LRRPKKKNPKTIKLNLIFAYFITRLWLCQDQLS